MLIPLTRKKFEELVPPVATGDQYKFYWGKPSDFLRRLLISIAAVVVITLVRFLIGEGFDILIFSVGFSVGFYWLWGPVFLASRRNREVRRYPYSGFWEGEVLDVFVSEELVGTEETVNNRGELVIVENRERCLNLEVGDDTGFYTKLQVPLKRDHRAIRPGDTAQMLVISNRPDLSRIAQATDIYLPDCNLWVSDYPFVRRDLFVDVSRRLVSSNELDSHDRATNPGTAYFETDQSFERDPRRSSRNRPQNRPSNRPLNRLIDRPPGSGRPQPRGRRSSRGY
jgi:hypothetical protein